MRHLCSSSLSYVQLLLFRHTNSVFFMRKCSCANYICSLLCLPVPRGSSGQPAEKIKSSNLQFAAGSAAKRIRKLFPPNTLGRTWIKRDITFCVVRMCKTICCAWPFVCHCFVYGEQLCKARRLLELVVLVVHDRVGLAVEDLANDEGAVTISKTCIKHRT